MDTTFRPALRLGRTTLLAGLAAALLSACAHTRPGPVSADYSGLDRPQVQAAVIDLSGRYRAAPRDRNLGIHYAAALRAAGQPSQAVMVMENLVSAHRNDQEVSIAYAKALTADGRFEQALAVIDYNLDPAAPHWEALSVRGAVLDQLGQHAEARRAYEQALLLAPGESALRANLGLSHAMSGELGPAEAHLRAAASLPGATSRVRQNLALVVGLQGRFEEARAIYAQELPPEEVEANMAYLRQMLGQRNRWDAARSAG